MISLERSYPPKHELICISNISDDAVPVLVYQTELGEGFNFNVVEVSLLLVDAYPLVT